ncbi:hypothetical protein [Actinomadura bangladeshensis]|nr:hypothetical protein [Actinomadura bangladeshensis]
MGAADRPLSGGSGGFLDQSSALIGVVIGVLGSYLTTQRLAAHRGLEFTVDPLDPEEGMGLLAQAESRRQAEWEAVLLVGEAETVAAARAWHEAVWNVEPWSRGLRNDQEGWTAASSTWRSAATVSTRARDVTSA